MAIWHQTNLDSAFKILHSHLYMKSMHNEGDQYVWFYTQTKFIHATNNGSVIEFTCPENLEIEINDPVFLRPLDLNAGLLYRNNVAAVCIPPATELLTLRRAAIGFLDTRAAFAALDNYLDLFTSPDDLIVRNPEFFEEFESEVGEIGTNKIIVDQCRAQFQLRVGQHIAVHSAQTLNNI